MVVFMCVYIYIYIYESTIDEHSSVCPAAIYEHRIQKEHNPITIILL